MKRLSLLHAILPLAIAGLLVGCEQRSSEPEAGNDSSGDTGILSITDEPGPSIYTSNYPMYYFTERIVGGAIPVKFPLPEEGDPAYWEPEPADVLGFQTAGLIIFNGATYEKWASHVTLPDSKILRTADAFPGSLIKLEDSATHSHGPEGDHTHAGTDFTTWLDPTLATQQASAILEKLMVFDPENSETYAENFQSLRKDLDNIDKTISDYTSRKINVSFVASHPVYDYMARRYDMNLVSVHWEPEEMPSEEQWEELAELNKEHGARWMIWEDEPLQEVADRLEKMDMEIIVFQPSGNRPDNGDYLDVMNQNLENLAKAYGE